MYKYYNTQMKLSSDLAKKFKKVYSPITKPQLKIIPNIVLGMIEAESVVTTDIVKKLKGSFSSVYPSSTVRRLERFFNNNKFDVYAFYDSIISNIISKYNPKNKNVYISVDHMFCRDAFIVLFFSLKNDKQGIPLWFRCFKGKHDSEAYKTSLIIDGISYIYNLFKDKSYNLIFLADRWFPNIETMKYIDRIGATYCIRAKGNMSIYIYNYDEMIGSISEVKAKKIEDQFFDKVLITKNKYRTKLAVSKLENHKEAFYILTNGKCEEAIKNYSYRFGSIEFVFKNQKSNGFYLEATKMKNIQAFKTMFGLMCVALLWLTLI